MAKLKASSLASALAGGEVNNHDIVGLYQRINRFLLELYKSASSAISEMNEFDQERLARYLDAIDNYHNWIINQPHLDLPETAPRTYALEAPPEVSAVENEAINDILRIFVVSRDELTNSQSARQPSNLNTFDSARFRNVVEKVRQLLVSYIQVSTPLDLPESSPQRDSSGTGHTGLNP